MLPDRICEFFDLSAGSTVEAFLDILDVAYDERLDGLISSEETRNAVRSALTNQPDQTFLCEERETLTSSSRLVKFVLDGRPSTFAMFGEIKSDTSIATALEVIAFRAICGGPTALLDKVIPPNTPALNWRRVFSHTAVICCDPGASKPHEITRIAAALFGFRNADLPRSDPAESLIEEASQVVVEKDNDLWLMAKSRLLSEAVLQTQPKWRFLSFYRLVEHAYLTNVKRKLFAAFDEDAKAAVREAEKSLQSEPNQLVTLAEEADLAAEFLGFNAQFDELLKGENRYLHSIERSAAEEPLYKQREAYKKAVIRFYKLRCSIAHGGTSSTIFEDHKDANKALSGLMADVEAIAIRSLGLQLD